MGDGFKISKDKRHRSSSSLAGVSIEGTRSERKLDIRASIPEVEDKFALAEARCDELQEKIDLVKVLKRKRKLKKRSMTRLAEPAPAENMPFITVRTQPKRKVTPLPNARIRRLEVPMNPTRGYLDPATVEQHRMLGQVRTHGQGYKPPRQEQVQNKEYTTAHQRILKSRPGRLRADGDGMCGHNAVQADVNTHSDLASRHEELSDSDTYDHMQGHFSTVNHSKPAERRLPTKSGGPRRRHVPIEIQDETPSSEQREPIRRRQVYSRPANLQPQNAVHTQPVTEERSVVELFNKSRASAMSPQPAPLGTRRTVNTAGDKRNKRVVQNQNYSEVATGPESEILPLEIKKEATRHPRRVKYRSRRYEMPTVASQMKQSGMRYYYATANQTNIPFVVSKSTAPSHNIGVNIQQVLNGMKIQQPLSGIPSTIAHHMGLGHVPTYGMKSASSNKMSLDNREINVIKLGPRVLRLPSYKYMSYSRLLTLYREGEGMVPRFLRAISRPHYFYTSMYNLQTNREDFEGTSSKARGGSQEAKQSLAEYASLYREYEQVDKCLKEGSYEPELELRKEQLSRELAAREEHIRKVVQEFRTPAEGEAALRASVSTTEEGYRHSTFNLNVGDH